MEDTYIADSTQTALVIEEDPIISNILQQHNYHIRTYHPRSITTTSMQSISTQIKERKVNLIWIDFPTTGRALPTGRRPASMRQLATWIRLAALHKIWCVLIGLRGRQWQDENLQLLVTDKIITEATINICALDIKVSEETKMPSSVAVHVAQSG